MNRIKCLYLFDLRLHDISMLNFGYNLHGTNYSKGLRVPSWGSVQNGRLLSKFPRSRWTVLDIQFISNSTGGVPFEWPNSGPGFRKVFQTKLNIHVISKYTIKIIKYWTFTLKMVSINTLNNENVPRGSPPCKNE